VVSYERGTPVQETPLTAAAWQGETTKLSTFLDATPSVNLDASDESGSTAMHAAAGKGHIETCEVQKLTDLYREARMSILG